MYSWTINALKTERLGYREFFEKGMYQWLLGKVKLCFNSVMLGLNEVNLGSIDMDNIIYIQHGN